MSRPQALFFDTGTLVALFNVKSEEQKIADKIWEYIAKFPTSVSRHVVTPCLVELVYFVNKNKKISPSDVKLNIDRLGISLFPLDWKAESNIYDSYFSIKHKIRFDYADYFICQAALQFQNAEVLTIDKNDFPLAVSQALKDASGQGITVHQLTPIFF